MMFYAFILQDQSPILIRMVGKRVPMKLGCNWLPDTNCMNGRPLIITKLGFETLPKRGARFGELATELNDGVDLNTVDEFGNSFLKKRLVPLIYPVELLPTAITIDQ